MADTTKTDSIAANAAAAVNKSGLVFAMSQDAGEALEKAGYSSASPHSPLLYALQQASGSANKRAPRLAFTENPAPSDNYLGLFKSKRRLLPDEVLKQIRIQDHLVAAILRARGSMMSLFGHLKKDRFDVGVEVALKKEFYEILTPEQFEKVMERINKFERILLNCGHTAGLEHQDRLTLSQFIDTQTQNGLNFGRFACFPEKTTVYTPFGPKSIEEVKQGDLVYSHDGSIQKVKNTMNKWYDDTLYGIYTSGNETVWCTKEHPFYTAKDKHQYANGVRFAAKANKAINTQWTKAEEIDNKDYIHFQNKLQKFQPVINIISLPEFKWKVDGIYLKGSRVTKNCDFFDKISQVSGYNRNVVQDVYANNYRSSTSAVLKEYFTGIASKNDIAFPECSSVPKNIVVNEQFAYFLGAFIGDGHTTSKSDNIAFDLGLDKINNGVQDKLKNFLSSLNIVSYTTPGNGKCERLHFYCPPFAKWLRENVGLKGYDKKIPACIWHSSDEIKYNFLAGLIDTDGCTINRTTVGVANEYLAKSMAILAGTVGIHAKVAKVKHNPEERKDMFICSFDSKNVLKINSLKQHEKRVCQKHISTDEGVFKRITNIYTKPYKGIVYNLEVENTNSYVVNGISVHNCEMVYDREGEADADGNYPFHRFRPIDVATIYRCVRKGEYVGNNLRETAIRMLESITGEKLNIDLQKLKEDHYAWLQVIDGTPRQAFTHREMLVFNLFPCTDIEMNGYPVSPLDTVVSSVTTHISIDAYKKLYFQNGRASKGMLVIRSDEVDGAILNDIKLQFNASVNNVTNSFRTPIFGMGKEDSVDWLPFTGEGLHDSDFQFMYDQIARNILSAFSISPDELPGYGHLSRGTNSQTLCLDLSTKIFVPEGYKTLKEILKTEDEVQTKVWTGKKWEKAKVFVTGEKVQARTKLSNSMEILSSPDHKFRAIGEDGEPVWKIQSELTENDWVLVNRKNASKHHNIPCFEGQELTIDLMEVLGWLTGDGNIHVRYNKSTQNIKSATISFFYHSKKERDIWDKHAEILRSFGLNPKKYEHVYSEFEKQRGMAALGASSYLDSTIRTAVNNTDFVKFLLSMGFTSSTDGKSIPAILNVLPEEYKCAFLKGFFSADGTSKIDSVPRIVIHNNNLREQTKHLLMSLGIRTALSEGKLIHLPNRDENGNRIKIETASYLDVKDKQVFYEKIGFIQNHKQPDEKDLICPRRQEKLPRSTVEKYVKMILEIDNGQLSKSEKNNLITVLNVNANRNVSAYSLIEILEKVKIIPPSWMKDFYCEKVVELINLKNIVEMADVEIFDDEHAFVANGIVVHNSESSNEFKLTAARDTGLRPLVLKLQIFLNQLLFPLIDPLLAKICEIKLVGLDAQSKEQEASRLQQDMPTFMTYDEVLREVDKQPVGQQMAGHVPFNERYQLILDKYKTVGEVCGTLLEEASSFVDPLLRYRRDPFFLQWMQLAAQSNPAAVQAYFAPRPFALDVLKMCTQDYLEEE